MSTPITRTPLEKIIRVLTMVLLVLFLTVYFFPAAGMMIWPVVAALVVAAALYVAVGIQLFDVIRQVRAGRLFFLRNISFYTNIGILIIVVVFYLYDFFVGTEGEVSWQFPLVMFALLLGYWTQTFSYLYLDSVRVTQRFGTATTTVPFFAIQQVREEKDGLTITAENGTELFVNQESLPQAQYAAVRSRLLT